MKNDYEILGLKEGADEKEVKRAYFKLVRQFPPEKEPERFQEIREAYENLKSGKSGKGLSLAIPEEAFAEKMMDQILRQFKQRDYWSAMNTAEEAIRIFGECEGFLYYLAIAQRKLDYSGKSVKNFEKLAKMCPDKVEFARELAVSYWERGFGKKAYTAFGKAYDMGCRDLEFLNCYAMNCEDRKDRQKSEELLFELISLGWGDLKENVDDLVNAHVGLLMQSLALKGKRLPEVEESLLKFLDVSGPYMADRTESLRELVWTALYVHKKLGMEADELSGSIGERVKKGIGTEKTQELMEYAEKYVEKILIEEDDRISETLKIVAENYESEYNEHPQIRRFAQLDCKLCILEEWPGIRQELEVMEKCYPYIYGSIREYVETLAHTDKLDVLGERLRKDYDRLDEFIHGGIYYDKYPHRRREEKIIAGGIDAQPYVRMQPKIGRNDPCPCGSGKKYKKCCGK